jgi:hypothetical protein
MWKRLEADLMIFFEDDELQFDDELGREVSP